MDDKLLKMDPQKRINLINAALEEFGNQDFDKASTNVMVKNAGVSKGLLYHYFTTKENLYNYLISFTMRTIADAIHTDVNWEEADLLKRLADITTSKMRIMETYPHMIAFSKKVYGGKSLKEVKSIAESYMPNIYTNVYQKNIDFSLFREDIDIQIAIRTVEFTIDKLSESMLATFSLDEKVNVQAFVRELDNYLLLFRTTFYK